jgi:hypothetical protein
MRCIMRENSCKTATVVLVLSVFLLQGCGSTRVAGVWKKSDFTGGPFQKILVVGLAKDNRNKSIWEDIMSEQLRKAGVNAITSADGFPGDADITKEEIVDYVIKNEMDGVLVTRVVNIIEEQAYYPPAGGYSGAYYGGNTYRHYNNFGTYYDTVYKPGHTATFTSVYLETNLYDTATQNLIWSMSSDTFDPSSTDKLAQSVSTEVVKSLQKDNLISQPR